MNLDEALELACLATHLGEEGASQRYRAEIGLALERQRGGVSKEDEREPLSEGGDPKSKVGRPGSPPLSGGDNA